MMLRLVLLTAALAGCTGPVVQSPLTGQTRYLCCNLHYEKTTMSDVNYLTGTLVPAGTSVQIIQVRSNAVTFQPQGQPPLTLKYEFGPKAGVPFSTFLDRLFVTTDPMTRLSRAEPARGRRGRKGSAKAAPSSSVRELIERGAVEPGMTRAQVLMSLGHPPAHRTPSLEGDEWHYWRNRWDQFSVVFSGDKVERVAE